MRIILSHFVHPDDNLERAAVGGAAEVFVQRGPVGRWEPLPEDIRGGADGIINFPPNTTVDGDPKEYSRLRALVRWCARESVSTAST
jgi:hypothetical protein